MSRCLSRSGLLLALLFASEVWALGLGDIRLDSALNEPLQAEIDLLSATPEELQNLKISLASSETFERYGIDRPLYLTGLTFNVRARGGSNVIVITSPQPITEPFVTFLVEAVWSSGRLLREYTVLLDPPTFAPAATTPTREQVAAPQQPSQADRGRIERAPAAPRPSSTPAASQSSGSPNFDTTAGGDYQVRRGDNLWRIAEQVRPDDRLSMNQTMLAIYEANPNAFAGNINVLRANAQLRIPSADEIFRISRGSALSEIQRQNQAWSGDAPVAQPTLTLVPPDSEQTPYQGSSTDSGTLQPGSGVAADRINQLEDRIAEQESLLEVRDNELAQLRSELARMRAERASQTDAGMPADDAASDPSDTATDTVDDGMADPADDGADEIFVDEGPADDAADDTAEPVADTAADDAADAAQAPAPRVAPRTSQQDESLVDKILGFLTSVWGLIGIAVLAVIGVLAWFARKAGGGDDEAESTGVWDALDADDDVDSESMASTERLRALARDDDTSIVVVEQQQGEDTIADEAVNVPPAAGTGTVETEALSDGDMAAPEGVSLEDTFSSETAINLDQSDPIAEADFHMAYGLYDQAADLINGALAVEPERSDLIAKLCEIYFVWGNRDAFVDAATRLKAAPDDSGNWDKIVIMGQQIAGDHELFSNVSAGATREVDLDFESSGDSDAELDIDFASNGPDGSVSDIVDFGEETADDTSAGGSDDDALDFSFDDDTVDTGASITQEMPGSPSDNDATVESEALDIGFGDDDATAESPALDLSDDTLESTVESPTIEQAADGSLEGTAELPALDSDAESSRSSDETAEIDLDDLGLDLEGLAGDLSDETGIMAGDDSLAATGRNEMLDDDASETDLNVKVDDDLLDATGQTQVLPDDFSVDTTSDAGSDLGDDDATMMSPGLAGADDPDFDFAKTEALPSDTYGDETADSPNLAGSTDMDLDLDDLTAALKLSESGDTIEQNRDDATVEQPRPGGASDDLDFDLGLDSDDPTQALGPDEVSDDLQEARTMTEVGTKLDLARAYVDMGDPGGAKNILEEVLEEGDESQRQQAQQLLDSLPG